MNTTDRTHWPNTRHGRRLPSAQRLRATGNQQSRWRWADVSDTCCRRSPLDQTQHGLVLRSVAWSPHADFPEGLSSASLNVDYQLHWSAQTAPPFFQAVKMSLNENSRYKKRMRPPPKIIFQREQTCSLQTWRMDLPGQDDFGSSYRSESHKGTKFNHPIPDCIDLGTTCNDYINKPFLCNYLQPVMNPKPSQPGPKWIMPWRNKLIKLTQPGSSTNLFSRFKSLKI